MILTGLLPVLTPECSVALWSLVFTVTVRWWCQCGETVTYNNMRYENITTSSTGYSNDILWACYKSSTWQWYWGKVLGWRHPSPHDHHPVPDALEDLGSEPSALSDVLHGADEAGLDHAHQVPELLAPPGPVHRVESLLEQGKLHSVGRHNLANRNELCY